MSNFLYILIWDPGHRRGVQTMSDLGWDAEDLVVRRGEAVVLNHALMCQLANEDLEEPFHAGELLAEASISRPSVAEALRRLVERGWLETWVEAEAGARLERRPARTYYKLSREGRHAAEALIGAKGECLLGRGCRAAIRG